MDLIAIVVTFFGITVALIMLYYQVLLRVDLEFHRGSTISTLRHSRSASRIFSVFAIAFALTAIGLLMYGYGTVTPASFFDKWALVPEVVGVMATAYFLRTLIKITD